MKRYSSWIFAAIAFCMLAFFANISNAHPNTVHWTTGNNLQDASTNTGGEHGIQGVRGTVSRITTKSTGERTIHLVSDDGANLVVVVMPTVDAYIPTRGTRVNINGRALGTGVLILDNKEDISIAGSQPKDDETLTVCLTNRKLARTGAHIVTMVDHNDGHFIGPAIVIKEVSLMGIFPDTQVEAHGHYTADHTFIIERIGWVHTVPED